MHQLSSAGHVALVTAAKSGKPSAVSRMVLSSNCGLRHHFIGWYVNPPVGSYCNRSESAPGGGFTSAPNQITPRYTTSEAPDGWKRMVPSLFDAVEGELLARERVRQAREGAGHVTIRVADLVLAAQDRVDRHRGGARLEASTVDRLVREGTRRREVARRVGGRWAVGDRSVGVHHRGRPGGGDVRDVRDLEVGAVDVGVVREDVDAHARGVGEDRPRCQLPRSAHRSPP